MSALASDQPKPDASVEPEPPSVPPMSCPLFTKDGRKQCEVSSMRWVTGNGSL